MIKKKRKKRSICLVMEITECVINDVKEFILKGNNEKEIQIMKTEADMKRIDLKRGKKRQSSVKERSRRIRKDGSDEGRRKETLNRRRRNLFS